MRALFLFLLFLLVIPGLFFGQTKTDYYNSFTAAANAKDWRHAETVARAGLAAFPDETGFTDNLVWALLEAGWQLFEKKDLPGSLALFKEAYSKRPDAEWVLNAYGVILRDTGELALAREILEKGYRLYPGNEYIKPNLLWLCILQANKLRDAANALAKAAPADSSLPALRAKAAGHFLRAGELDSKNESFLLNYGGFLSEQGKYQESRKYFEQGEKLFPEKPWWADSIQYSYQEEIHALAAGKKYEPAIALLLTAISKFPNETWLQSDLIEYYFQTGNFKKSAEALRVLAANKNLQEYRKPLAYDREELILFRSQQLVWKFAELKDYSSAFALLDSLEKAMPAACFINEQRGVLLFWQGEKEKAIDLANKAYDMYIALHPEAKQTLTLPLPIAGPVKVGGNNRRDAITHAGTNRYCYDFMGCDRAGNLLKPGIVFPGKQNTDYFGFGMALISPVDGVVEDVIDSYADIAPRADAVLGDGNQVTIRDAAGRHYVFAHIRRGSALVVKGQQIHRGDKIAEMGNTGYTAIPHFHFGVYTPDWRVSIEVKFEAYTLVTQEGRAEVRKLTSIPQNNDVIMR